MPQTSTNSDNSSSGWIDTLRVDVPGEAPLQGQTLTAFVNLGDTDNLGALHYQWLADGQAIAGAIGSTLLLGQALVGKRSASSCLTTMVAVSPNRW